MTGGENKHMSTQWTLSSSCDANVAMQENNWLFKNCPLFEANNTTLARCMSSAFHKVQ